ncbi:hypothetical protein C900_00439 [Fulvivirga imtechensis AK7]|uniref:Uncharacterized protein n=2 Tax=Fulvivirga TaxID=396811 RepID=L8JLZ5_9BACT|nr:hypothetical protein C900_00439 [Fulvivirga imtechensis AK7]
MSFYLSQMHENTKVVQYPKAAAKSTFYNASDIACFPFYKNPSLIIDLNDQQQ